MTAKEEEPAGSAASAPLGPFTVEAPGRVCLFGEHQDYLHLPVIAVSLPLKCRIRVQPRPDSRVLTLRVPALSQVQRYDLDRLPPRQGTSIPQRNDDPTGSTATLTSSSTTTESTTTTTTTTPTNDGSFQPDFALAAIYEALDDGWQWSRGGADCESTTDLPLQAGCSSSSAFCVAWSLVLARLADGEQDAPLLREPIRLAQRAHRAEVTHFGAPGGTMDHVTSAVGGLLRIAGPDDPWHVERLSFPSSYRDCWVLAYSGEPKDTFGHLHRCKNARLALLDKLGGDWDAAVTSSLSRTTSQPVVDAVELSHDERILLQATLVNRDTERQAAREWQSGAASGQSLGRLMQRHHDALRDGLHLSTATLERLREVALNEGAYGFKVVGSGGGGCGVAWSPRERAASVAKALQSAGAPQVWIIDAPGRGASLTIG